MSAKILLLDIETAPSVGYVWGKYDQNVIEMERDWFVLSFAYKWLDSLGVTVRGLPDYEGYKPGASDDKKLMSDLWELLNAADIVVAHNGDSFDIKKSNARFLAHNLSPPATYKTFDTLKMAKKHFRFDSNRLNDLGKSLGIGTKVPHVGFALCFRDPWNPSQRLHTWIAFQRPFGQFPKGLAVETEGLSSSGIEGSQTVEHLEMLLHAAL